MTYLTINGHDYSNYVNNLKITRMHTYRSQTCAAGNTVVDNVSSKRQIEVGIIALDDEVMPNLLNDVYGFEVSLGFRNPQTNQLEEDVTCIIPTSEISHYTIQSNKVIYNGFTLTFTEL